MVRYLNAEDATYGQFRGFLRDPEDHSRIGQVSLDEPDLGRLL